MGLTSKTTLLSLEKVGPWGPAIRVKYTGNTDKVIGAWGPRYFVGGTGNLVYVKTAANTWSEVSNVYLKTAVDTWSAVSQFCVKKDASTWDGTGDEMSGSDLVFPVFQSAATNTDGTKVILTYNKTLSATTAAASAFAVTAFSGSIVSTNLKLHLDAGDSTSYGGSGTTWIDLISGDNARSVDFDGTDDKLSIPDSTDFEFGSGDFTIEAWVKQENAAGSANTTDHTIVNKWHNTSNAKEWILRIQGDYLQWLQTQDGSTNQYLTGNTVINAGEWYHVAAVGHSGTIKLFVNGTQQSSTLSQGTINAHSNELIFGYNKSTDSSWMDGLMSNCRIVKGTAVYTSSFTPPTEPLTNITNTKFLGLNNASITSATVTPGTITASSSPTASISNPFGVHGTISGATYSSSDGGIFDFDGTNDYVSIGSSSDFTFGTGDFTVECWVKPDDFGSRGTFFDSRPSNGNTGITIGHESSSGEIRVYMTATSGTDIVVQSSDFEVGKWQHIAVTRSSGTVTLFINGVSKDSGTRTSDLNNTNAVNIGYKTYTSSTYDYFDGEIAQVRVYKGTGLTAAQVAANYNATKTHFAVVSSVATSGANVELTMQSGIHPGETVTVAYTDPSGSDDANSIQDSNGLDAISLSTTSVTNNVVPPAFQSAATDTIGSKVILTYNQTLSSTTAAASAFVVTDGGSAVTVSSVAVSGSTVELTMQSPITVGAAITVAYTDPSGSDDANAVQGTTGVDVASLSATSVTNNAAAPVFQSAATNNDGTKVILTYNEALSSTTAATSAFAVVVNSSAATVSSVAVSGSTVELTMGTAITSGTATVAYTDPSGSDDSNAVQGAGGIDAASFTATSITLASAPIVYDFTTGSVPSGWVINSSAQPTGSKFTDSTDGDYYLIKGNCNDQLGFPLRNTTAFQGDNLFQLSFYASDVDCRDWGVAVTEHTYTSTTAADWYWKWNVTTNVLSAKCNCSNPTLYGFTSKQETGGSVGDDQTAQWYTMHFMVYTSTASTKLKITQGQSDWDGSGTQVGTTKSVSDRIVSNSTTDYWFGIGADNDETSYAKASGCRISEDSSDFF